MKKTILTLFAATTLMLSSCMTMGTGTGTTANTGSSTDVLGSVLGAVLSNVLFGGQSGILGSWNYTAPTTAFTTQQALTNAGSLTFERKSSQAISSIVSMASIFSGWVSSLRALNICLNVNVSFGLCWKRFCSSSLTCFFPKRFPPFFFPIELFF